MTKLKNHLFTQSIEPLVAVSKKSAKMPGMLFNFVI